MSKFIDWWGCYDDGWRDLIVSDAYQHPAKYRPGLIKRIYHHGFERGWWVEGDVIGDPFGGIGGGGIMAAYQGLRWIGVELEERFKILAEKNFALHRKGWQAAGDPIPEIIQGDSREFARLVACSAIVTSPPWEDQQPQHDNESFRPPHDTGEKLTDSYGDTPGQIGNLKAIVTSPPYADSVKGDHGETETASESRDKRETPGGSLGQSQRHGGYGVSEGNIGNLKACVTSPPWENQEPSHAQGDSPSKDRLCNNATGGRRFMDAEYGESKGQLGNTSGESYWQAMELVYGQCRLSIRPGGVLVVVIKDFVKGGKRVPLCDQTLALLESLGFVLVERIRAWVTQTTVHEGLFGQVKEVVERKSFFRRLAEKKGSPPIDWEEVICVRTIE